MGFAEAFGSIDFTALEKRSVSATAADVSSALHHDHLSIADFAALISPAGEHFLEPLTRRSQSITQKRFGKVIRFFAPIYLSNECINNCAYCGFSRDNPIFRLTLTEDQALQEARELKNQGFRNLLLVAGEHPKFIPTDYLVNCVRRLQPEIPSLSLEVGPLDTPDYARLVDAGAEGLVVYQETYNNEVYASMHTAGPKRDFGYRLDTAERAYQGGFRRLGIGALLGLTDWRYEVLRLATHAEHLLKTCWKAQLTISLPRLRPCAGDFNSPHAISDKSYVQTIAAFRLMFPDVGLVLSTREPAKLRDGLMSLGITMMSAGSHTEPGGYTGTGKEELHFTERGRKVAIGETVEKNGATGQFEIADERTPAEVAEQVRRIGYEPVWKDWDSVLAIR